MAVVRRRLDVELVRRGLADSRTGAARLIDGGRVRVGGLPATTAARRVDAGTAIALIGDGPQYVSRGGHKLAGALDDFGLVVEGRRALDAGDLDRRVTDVFSSAGRPWCTRSTSAADSWRGGSARTPGSW